MTAKPILLSLLLGGQALAVTIANGPFIAYVERTSAVIAWDTDLASPSVVNYGTTPSYGLQVVGADATVSLSGWANHEVRLTGLAPDTQYYYQVKSGNASSPPGNATYWFRTAVDEGTPFRFVSMADSRNNSSVIELLFGMPPNFETIFARILTLSPYPRFVLFPGDAVYGDDDPSVLRQEWDIWKTATDRVHRNIPIYYTPGNHEAYHSGAEDLIRDVWAQPANGGLTPLGSLPWNLDELAYSFDYGVVHFTAYDTNIDADPLKYNAPPEETAWLATDLGNAVPMHRVVYGHTEGSNPCIFGLGASLEETSQANYQDFYSAMAAGGVAAYSCGHIHNWVGDGGIMGVAEVMNGTCGAISSTSFCGVVADHFVVWDVSCGQMTAHVYDQDGVEITQRGAPFTFTAQNKTPPDVSLVSPVAGSTICATVDLEATSAAHNCEQVDRVEFSVDGALVGVVSTAPYILSWDSTSVANGSHTIVARSYDTTGASGLFRDSSPVVVTVDNSKPCTLYPANILAGPGPGIPNPNTVDVYNASGALRATFAAYATGKWGTNGQGGPLDADGIDEAVTGPGPGDVFGPHVRGFRRDGTPMGKISFFAYGTLRFGVNSRMAPVDNDGYGEILTGPGPGAVFGPHVRGFDFDASKIAPINRISFFAYRTLKWGTNVAGGDVDGDSFAEILTGPGPGTVFGAQARGFNYDGNKISQMGKLNAFLFATGSYGLVIESGKTDGDSYDEILAGKGPGPSFDSRIRGFDYDTIGVAAIPGIDLKPYSGATQGCRVAAGDIDQDGFDEIVTGPGPNPASASRIRGFNVDGGTATAIPTTDFTAFAGLGYGVNIAIIEANYP